MIRIPSLNICAWKLGTKLVVHFQQMHRKSYKYFCILSQQILILYESLHGLILFFLPLFKTYFHLLFWYYVQFSRPLYLFWNMVGYNKFVEGFLFNAKDGNMEPWLSPNLQPQVHQHSSPILPWCLLCSFWSSTESLPYFVIKISLGQGLGWRCILPSWS